MSVIKKNKHVTLFYKELLPIQAVCIVVILLEPREQEQEKLSTCVNLSKIRVERPNQGKEPGGREGEGESAFTVHGWYGIFKRLYLN